MKRYQKFFVYWIINVVLLYLANMFFPKNITVGNSILAPYQSLVFNGFVLSVAITLTEPVTKYMEIPMKDMMTMMLIYLGVNFATIWFIARFAFMTGIGISSFVYVLGIAVVANLVQYFAWQYMEKKK